MSAKTRSLDTIVREERLGQVVQRERALMDSKIETAIAAFYKYLLDNGHLKPTAELDREVRAMVDSGELRPDKPVLIR